MSYSALPIHNQRSKSTTSAPVSRTLRYVSSLQHTCNYHLLGIITERHLLDLLIQQIADRLSIDLAAVSLKIADHCLFPLVLVDEIHFDDATRVVIKAGPIDRRYGD